MTGWLIGVIHGRTGICSVMCIKWAEQGIAVCVISRRLLTLWRRAGGVDVLTKHGPVDVWAEILTAHGAAGSAFNLGATFGGDRPHATYPLVDGRWRNTQTVCQCSDTTHGVCSFFDWMCVVHVAKVSLANDEKQ